MELITTAVEKTDIKNHLRDLGINRRITLKIILEKHGVNMWTKCNSERVQWRILLTW
jgi:hypothetical protein